MDKLEIAKEAVRIYFSENITASEAIKRAISIFKEGNTNDL